MLGCRGRCTIFGCNGLILPVKNGQVPPARAPVEQPAQRRRVAPVEVSETLG